MPRFTTTRSVPHPASDMFALVADLESYPLFVPLCTGMTVQAQERAAGGEVVMARMSVAYGPISESFTSRVRLDRERMTIRAEAVDGPFRRMENDWLFEPMDEDECTVRFNIDYEFRSLALGLLVGGMFDRVFRKFAAAFLRRADAVYGGVTGATGVIPPSRFPG